ncbi:MAG: WYL domain-containing protein, partial [Bacteroidales bacterium]|nr:WYL domain-containing protein [Bacteroidales bacterium]
MNRLYHLKRYAAVINKLTNIQYVSKEELLAAVKESCDGHEPDIRTLQRDFAAIYEIFGVSIKFERGRGYCIADKDEVSET